MGHPRKQLNFMLDSLHAAESALKTLRSIRAALPAAGGNFSVFTPLVAALQDDLNTPGALGSLFTTINTTTPADINAVWFDRAMFALGLDLAAGQTKISAPAEISALAEKRWAAKQAKDFATADALRKELAAAGWSMLDSKTDYKLEPLKK